MQSNSTQWSRNVATSSSSNQQLPSTSGQQVDPDMSNLFDKLAGFATTFQSNQQKVNLEIILLKYY
jgi:hypothetical protein